MRKKILIALGAIAVTASISYAAQYAVVSFDVGDNHVRNIGVAKIEQVEVSGSTVAAGTVILSVVRDNGATTNELVSVTCSSGAAAYTETNSVFLVAGDHIIRSGTATNGSCRVIVSQ